MSIELKDLEHVCNLAHLDIKETEKQQHLIELRKVLEHMKSIQKLDLSNIKPTSHNNLQPTLLREDEIENQSDLLLQENAPIWEDKYFHAPKIL
jgi:aspartyl-tRNA(Asn)/glutamyl-tRNA(Gln) amidotransferase subunit C